MSETVRYVFGLLGGVMASLVLWFFFMSAIQPQMYTAMNFALKDQWNMVSGNDGERQSRILNSVWEDTKSISGTEYWEG